MKTVAAVTNSITKTPLQRRNDTFINLGNADFYLSNFIARNLRVRGGAVEPILQYYSIGIMKYSYKFGANLRNVLVKSPKEYKVESLLTLAESTVTTAIGSHSFTRWQYSWALHSIDLALLELNVGFWFRFRFLDWSSKSSDNLFLMFAEQIQNRTSSIDQLLESNIGITVESTVLTKLCPSICTFEADRKSISFISIENFDY